MSQIRRKLTQHACIRAGLQIVVILGCLLTAACAPLQPIGMGSDAGANARELSDSGDHVAASRAYLDLAVNARSSQRQRYLIFAAGELYLANDLEGAERILQQAGDEVADENIEVWAEVVAEIRLARNEPAAALNALNKVSSTDRQSAASRILLLRSEALFQLGRAEPAVATLLVRESVLTEPQELAANNRLIWSGMQNAGQSIPADPKAGNGDPLLTGWLQVGHIAFRQRGSLSGLYNALNNWRNSNPDHPASLFLQQEVLPNLSALSTYPQQVAILLPLSGKQKAYGEAIRDGFLAAHFELGNETQRPDVNFYDTAKDTATETYRRAALDGAAFIIGPLLKKQVAEIAPLAADVPTLTLNSLPPDQEVSPSLYQFALAPEDEARAAAIRAADEGLINAVALVEDSEWGRRVLNTFGMELEARGGKLLSASGYISSATDFSNAIKRVLLLDESYARRDRLAANLGQKLEFEPRRRQDVDFIFLASKSKAARQIKPQLKFHYAGDIPTYATADVYQPGSTDNSDLNGLYFPDIPWLLKPTQAVSAHQEVLNRHWGARSAKLARFYALGYDSYHLAAMLHGRSRRDALNMEGMTGKLWADSDGIIHRDLKWARFERGTTRTLPDIQRSLTQDAEIVVTQQ